MAVEYNKRDLIATGGAVVIILVVFIPSILVHFHSVKDGGDKDVVYVDNSAGQSSDWDWWFREAQNSLLENIRLKEDNSKPARNIIFFLGDGMGISTLTAAR